MHESRQAFKSQDGLALQPLQLTQLEERILMSASPMAVVAAPEAAMTATEAADGFQSLDDQQLLDVVADSMLPNQSEQSAADDAADSASLQSRQSTLELVFLDSNVSNLDQMIADLKTENASDPSRTLEFVVLDSTKDGIAQITSALLKYNGIDGMHIVSHGSDGKVQLGSTILSLDNLNTYRNAISAWQYSMSDKADLLFYGCDLAASTDGQQLLSELGQLTQSFAEDSSSLSPEVMSTSGDKMPPVVDARDVVLIDTQLQDSSQLIGAANSGAIVFTYDGTSESATSILDRVADWAQQSQTDIRTLSMLSHGVAGGFELGNQWITTSTFDSAAAEWTHLSEYFVQDADIYILGCNVGAAGGGGQQLLNELAFTTSAEVYASDDVTGVGGDWILEMASAGNATLDAAALGQVFDVTELQATNVSLAWYSASWQYRQAVTVSASLLDGSVDETNFTILVDVTQASLKSTSNGGNVAQTDGGDILFTSSDGTTKLSHQIESYDAVTGRIKAWVKLPTLLALSNTSLYAYYGNAAAADQWNDSGAWNSTYGGVWHLFNGSFADSTSNANNGTNVGSTNTTAIIEEGRSFNGTSQNITVADSNSLDEATLITISAWINPTVNDNSWRSIVGKGPDNAASNYWFGIRQSQLEFWTGGTGYDSNVNISLNTWSHVASTFNASTNTLRIYVNGAEIYSNTSASATPGINSDPLYIGRSSLNNEWWQGALDEVRFQNTEESANEIESQYRTQSSSVSGKPFFVVANGV